jgi:uncharacterized protein YbjT (DUF2867 family)
MVKKYEMTILLTDPTGNVGNAVINRLASSGRNIIRKAIDGKGKVDKLSRVYEIANINYNIRETIADTLNDIERISLRSPPISSNILAMSAKSVECVNWLVKI